MRGAVLALLALMVLSCAQRVPPPSTPPPAFDRPSAVIPGDLDLALRVDLVALGRFLGPDARGAFALTLADPKDDAAVAAFVVTAFERADALWVALRPGRSAAQTDNVVVLRGRFAELSPPRRAAGQADGFDGPIDLGGAFRVYERPRPVRRSAPARIYARGDDWLVFVSEAEVDSVERAIELRAGDEHVDPEDRGIASLSMRAPPLVEKLAARFPGLEVLRDATLMEAVAEAAPNGLSLLLSVQFADAEIVREVTPLVNQLLDGLREARGRWGRVARSTRVEELGTVLLVRSFIDTEGLSEILACAAGGHDC